MKKLNISHSDESASEIKVSKFDLYFVLTLIYLSSFLPCSTTVRQECHFFQAQLDHLPPAFPESLYEVMRTCVHALDVALPLFHLQH